MESDEYSVQTLLALLKPAAVSVTAKQKRDTRAEEREPLNNTSRVETLPMEDNPAILKVVTLTHKHIPGYTGKREIRI
jgi:hypothetical protein